MHTSVTKIRLLTLTKDATEKPRPLTIDIIYPQPLDARRK